jgi:hypothetical protein
MLCNKLGRTVLALAACAPLAALAATDATPVSGLWQKHEYTLDYVGFTATYSCDGLEGKMRLLLRAAGARDDIKIRTSCSNPFQGPSRIAVATVTFYALVPEPAAGAAPAVAGGKPPDGKAAAPAEPGVGAWRTVEFREGRPYWLDAGDCELVEQFDRQIVPLFTTRNHESHMSCVPHEQIVGSIAVRFDTLAPLPRADAARPATAQ